jgi:hypothetical protein
MSYIVNGTDGNIRAVVNDGTIDSTTSLNLVGIGYTNYAETIAEDFVRLLENFSNVTAPRNPLIGQVWFNRSINKLQVYNGIQFTNVNNVTRSSASPSNSSDGDFWYNTNTLQLFFSRGSTWQLISPIYTPDQGRTEIAAETIVDSNGMSHVIVSVYCAGSRIIIIGNDNEFTPVPSISGFPVIYPGINVANIYGLTHGTINVPTVYSDNVNTNSLSVSTTLTNSIVSNTGYTFTDNSMITSQNGNIHISPMGMDAVVANNDGTVNVANTAYFNNGIAVVTGSIMGNDAELSTVTATTINTDQINANNINGNILTSSQPYITSLGTLTSLNVSGVSTFGDNSSVKISGGLSGQILSTDGLGNLEWQTPLSLPQVPNVSGIANQIGIFNAANSISGTSNLTYNSATSDINILGQINLVPTNDQNNQPLAAMNVSGKVNVAGLNNSGVATLGGAGNVHIYGGAAGQFLSTDGQGNLNWASAPRVQIASGQGISVSYNRIGFDPIDPLGIVGIYTVSQTDLGFLSSSANGYQRLPSGLIIQWGSSVTTSGRADTVYFPTPFPNACFSVTVNEANASGWIQHDSSYNVDHVRPTVYGVSNLTKTSFLVYGSRLFGWYYSLYGYGEGAEFESGLNFNWMAIGF